MRADLRLAVPAAVAWVIVAILVAVPSALPWAAAGLWASTIIVTVVAFGRRSSGSRGLLGALVLCCAMSAMLVTIGAVRAPDRQPAEFVQASDSGRHAIATVVATERVQPGEPFDGTLVDIRFGSRDLIVEVPVTVFPASATAGSPPTRAAIGTTLTVPCTLVANDPTEGSAFRLFATAHAVISRRPPAFFSWSNGLRHDFGAVSAGLPGAGGALLPGLAIGDTSGVDQALNQAMKSSALSHLTAVSGANCAVIIALIMLIGRRLGLARAVRIVVASVVLAGFVVLVTPQPSVLRAAVMAAIVLLALARGRPARGLPVLALATIVLLASDPWLCRDYGFVLSVLATAGLMLLAPPLAVRLGRVLPDWLAMVIAIPLSAQLACQPVLILLNPTIPTYGVIANLLAEPAAPIATVLGLIACILSSTIPALGTMVAQAAWVPAAWIGGVARFFSALPGNGIPWPPGTVGVVLIVVVTALMLVGLLHADRRVRLIGGAALALALVGVVAVTAGDQLREQLSRPQDWQIAACDIGQGDAVLVRSLGAVALIDTGPDPGRLSTCLRKLGIRKIDLLILSHYDLDHVGGSSAVFGRVTRALIGPTADANDEHLAEQLAASGALVEHVSKGLTGVLGELGWQILWPKAVLGGVEPGNDASVTVRFGGVGDCTDGCLSSIFLGDLGEEPQALVLAANPTLERVDVVKVAHHGSADQNERMYARLSASVGLISVGKANRYGHPTDRLLGILATVGTRAMRTDLEGMVLVSPLPGGGESVWSEHSMSAAKRLRH
jgi:competence protein ComEC